MLSVHDSPSQQWNLHNGTQDQVPMPFSEDPSLTNMDLARLGDGFDPQNLSADLSGYHDLFSITFPSTVFTAGQSSLAPINFGVFPPPVLNHAAVAPPPSHVGGPNRHRFVCEHQGCSKSYTRRPDMLRHASSHNAAAHMFYCHHPGCPRGVRGFLRKDKRTAHLKAVHGA